MKIFLRVQTSSSLSFWWSWAHCGHLRLGSTAILPPAIPFAFVLSDDIHLREGPKRVQGLTILLCSCYQCASRRDICHYMIILYRPKTIISWYSVMQFIVQTMQLLLNQLFEMTSAGINPSRTSVYPIRCSAFVAHIDDRLGLCSWFSTSCILPATS